MTEDERLFTEPESISQYLYCSVCSEVFRGATRLHCGHTFCGGCIDKWEKKGNNTCPQCRERFSKKTNTRDLLAYNLISELKVRCPHSGCVWIGPLSNQDSHLSRCSYHPNRVDKWLSQLSDSSLKKFDLLKKVYGRDPGAAKLLASAGKAEEVVPFSTYDSNTSPVKRLKAKGSSD